MCKSRFIFVAFLTFLIGSFFAYTSYSNQQISNRKIVNFQPEPQIIQEIKTEKVKKFDRNGEEIYWQGTSEGFNIRWTDKDIYVEKDGKTQKLFSTYVDYLFSQQTPKLKSLKIYCSSRISANILSIVGNLMTIEINNMTFCPPEAHPSDEPLWIVVDLNKLENAKFNKPFGNSIKLTDIFSDKDVLEAMLENEEIKQAMNEIDTNYKPKTAIELARWFRIKEETWDSDKVSYYGDTANFARKGQLNENSLSDFSFEKVEDDYVFVNLGLQPVNRSSDLPTLSVKLKIPDKIKHNFESANSKQNGFLSEFSITGYTTKDFEVGLKYRKTTY